MTNKKEKIESEAEAKQIKRQARKIILKGSLTAFLIMVFVMAIP